MRLTLSLKHTLSAADAGILVSPDRHQVPDVIAAMLGHRPARTVHPEAALVQNARLNVGAVRATESPTGSEESTIVIKAV